MIKVPPSAVDLEKALLGAILLERDAFDQVADLLKPEMFYSDTNRIIYEQLRAAKQKEKGVDLKLFCDHLIEKGLLDKVGGIGYVAGLLDNVVSSYYTVKHAQKIVEKYVLREQIRIAGELMSKAYEHSSDPFENQQEAERQLHELANIAENNEAQRIDAVVVKVVHELETLRHRENWLTGVTSGYSSLDKNTMGFQRPDLIILAARPAVGKTAFTLSLAVHAAIAGNAAAFFSLEMGAEQLVKRVLASQAKIYLSTIKGARLDDRQMQTLYTKGVQPVSQLPLYIDDKASMTVLDFKARLRRMVRKYEVRIAFVDYLQLLKSSLGKNANRQQQIGEISRELKITAKELNIPIVALSQLSREVEKQGRTPVLSDLREAGDIEQDADVVMFLYGHHEKEIQTDADKANEIFLKVAKQRSGSLTNLKFHYDKDYQVFTDGGEASENTGLPSNFRKIEDDNPF